MEPQREEQKKPAEPRPEEKPKRFHLIKLEERIAPKMGNGPKTNNCGGNDTVAGSTLTSIQ
jgi:hypothetical protein